MSNCIEIIVTISSIISTIGISVLIYKLEEIKKSLELSQKKIMSLSRRLAYFLEFINEIADRIDWNDKSSIEAFLKEIRNGNAISQRTILTNCEYLNVFLAIKSLQEIYWEVFCQKTKSLTELAILDKVKENAGQLYYYLNNRNVIDETNCEFDIKMASEKTKNVIHILVNRLAPEYSNMNLELSIVGNISSEIEINVVDKIILIKRALKKNKNTVFNGLFVIIILIMVFGLLVPLTLISFKISDLTLTFLCNYLIWIITALITSLIAVIIIYLIYFIKSVEQQKK